MRGREKKRYVTEKRADFYGKMRHFRARSRGSSHNYSISSHAGILGAILWISRIKKPLCRLWHGGFRAGSFNYGKSPGANNIAPIVPFYRTYRFYRFTIRANFGHVGFNMLPFSAPYLFYPSYLFSIVAHLPDSQFCQSYESPALSVLAHLPFWRTYRVFPLRPFYRFYLLSAIVGFTILTRCAELRRRHVRHFYHFTGLPF